MESDHQEDDGHPDEGFEEVVVSDVEIAGEDDDEGEEIDHEDAAVLDQLHDFLVKRADILPSLARKYGVLLVKAGVGSVRRLEKKVNSDSEFLRAVGIREDDAKEITDLIITGQKATHAEPPQEHQAAVAEASEVLPSPAHKTVSIEESGDASGSSTISNSLVRRTPRKSSVFLRPINKETLDAATSKVDQLHTALAGRMDVAVVGVLIAIAKDLEGSTEKQRAFFRAELCVAITQTLVDMIAFVAVCEKSMQVMALMCRHTDDVKSSVCLENAKGLNVAGAPDAVVSALLKYSTDVKILEASCDVIRCMCCLDSNRVTFGELGACEAVARSLGMSKFVSMPDICCWICRAIGHLAMGNDANRARLGSVGACETVIAAMQQHQANVNVCVEVCWAVRHLAPSEANRIKLNEEFCMETIISVMKSYISSEPFMLEACKALVSCIQGEDDDLIPRIANAGAIPLVLKSLRKHSTSDGLSKWVLNLLFYMSCYPHLVSKLIGGDVLDILSGTLEMHAGTEGTAEWGCRIVHNLCKNDIEGVSNKMRSAGLCEMVVSCVQRQAISHVVCGVGCLAIGDLAKDKANHSRLAQSGACEAVVGALKRHDKYPELVTQTCYAIHFLADTDNNISWMGANAGCEAVTSALNKHIATSVPTTQSALQAVGSLAYKNEGNCVRFFTAGACAAIVQALRVHGTDSLVSQYACRAVYNLCADNQNVSEFGAKGACGLVVSVLMTHARSVSVVTQALLAISGLAVKRKNDKPHNGNTRKLVAKGAIENVIAAMQKYPLEADLQRAGGMAMAALARLEANREKLGSSGAVTIILSAWGNHCTNDRVLTKIALATDTIASGSELNKSKFASGDIVEILLRALHKHERSAEFVGPALRALVTMSSHDASKGKIRAENSIRLYVKVMRLHEKDVEVAKRGCNLIYSCAADDVTRERLGQAKSCEAVINAMQKHAGSNSLVASWGCKAIIALCALESNRHRFYNSETCNVVVVALKSHPDDVVTAEWACFAVVTLSLHEPNRSKLGAAGACDALCSTLTKMVSVSEVVTKLACEAIYDLSLEESNRQLMGSAGACEILVTTLSTHLHSIPIAQQACRAIAGLARFSSNNLENSTKLGSAGACELVTNCIQTHLDVPPLLEWACAAIAALADRNNRNQTILGTMGGINGFALDKDNHLKNQKSAENICTLLVVIMTSHRGNAILCAHAARAVRALSSRHPENALRLALAGIVPVSLKALKQHSDVDAVIEYTCWILGHIIAPEVEPVESAFIRSDSADEYTPEPATTVIPVPTTIDTVSPTAAAIGIQRHGSMAPSSATAKQFSTSTPNCRDLYKMPVHWDLLQAVLNSSYTNETLARWICCAICSFADHGQLIHLALCDAVMTAHERHADKELVVQRTMSAIGSLSYCHNENRSRLSSRNACEAVDQLLTVFHEGESTCIGAFRAIHGLSHSCESNQGKFHSFQHFPKNFIRAFYNELESEVVCRWGCAAIASLATKHTGNQDRLRAATYFLAEAISTHVSAPLVAEEGCRAISMMAHGHIANRNRLGASDACDIVPKVLIQYMDYYGVAFWAVRAVADLAANNPNNQTKLGVSGACEALVAVAKRCLAKFNLSFESDKRRRSSSGFIGANANAKSDPVTIALFDATATTTPNAVRWGESDPESVYYQLTRVREEELAKYVCWALGNIVQLGKGGAMIIDEGQQNTGKAESRQSTISIGSLGGLAGGLGIGGVSTAAGGVGGVKKGVFARSLNTVVKNTARLSNCGAVEVILYMVQCYMENPIIVQWACRAINNFAKSRTLKKILLGQNGNAIIDQAIAKYVENKLVSEWAHTAMDTLLSDG